MSAILSDRLPGGAAGLSGFGGGLTRPERLDGGMWDIHRADLLGGPDGWRSDPGLRLLAPGNAEDARHVPVLADATGLSGVGRMVVTIDYSPFPLALVFHPGRALPLLGFGVKYETAGPIRASALIGEGATGAEWIMGGAFIDAMGGGCSAPAVTHARPDWQDGFGEMRARLWPDTGRLRIAIRHPMDTGLADGVPAHHLTDLLLTDPQGEEIARLDIHEPLEENPVLTFLLPPDLAQAPVVVTARDTSGFRFSGRVAP